MKYFSIDVSFIEDDIDLESAIDKHPSAKVGDFIADISWRGKRYNIQIMGAIGLLREFSKLVNRCLIVEIPADKKKDLA